MKAKALAFDELIVGIDKVISNAAALVEDARILFAAGRVSRAYTLGHLAREELAKIPMMFRVGTQILAGMPSDWKKFWRRFRDHKEKLRVDAVAQVTALASQLGVRAPGLLAAAPAVIEAKNDRKNQSLYVSYTENGFVAPGEVITPVAAERTVLLATSALGNAHRYAATLKSLASVPQERLRETFLAVEARLQDPDQAKLIDGLLERGVALHRAASEAADALSDEVREVSTASGPDVADVCAEDVKPGPG